MNSNGKPEASEGHKFSHNKLIDSETRLTFIILLYENLLDPSKNIRVAIAPDYGSNIVQFRVGDRDVFHTDKEALKDDRWTGCFVMWPLPNRYDRNGKKEYEFEGQVVSLEDIQRKEGNKPLIHGLVDNQRWQYDVPFINSDGVNFNTRISITEASPLYKHFPYNGKLSLLYTLSKDGLIVTYTVTNGGVRNMPSVFGLHPYYNLLGGSDGTYVKIPARSAMRATSELLPTGEIFSVEGSGYDLNQPKAVDGMMFDDVFTDLVRGEHAYIEYPELGLRINHKVSDDFTHAVLFTQKESDLGFVCLEPQTGSSNAINLDARAIKEDNAELSKAAHLISILVEKVTQEVLSSR